MRFIVVKWVSVALALGAAALFSQVSAQIAPRTPVVFLEKAYFSFKSPKGLFFEGQPTVHYFLWNRLSDTDWQREGGWKMAWPISAVFQVRMSDTTSMPVRTPSYRIRPILAQLFLLRRDPGKPDAFSLLGLNVGAAHYSNGQAGCTYLGYEHNAATGKCEVSDAALAAQSRMNMLDGDFSTTYFSLGTNWRAGRLVPQADTVQWQYTIGAEIQIHPIGLAPGGINREQARQWGQHQWTVSAEIERRYVPGTTIGLAHILGAGTGMARLHVLHEQRFAGHAPSRLQRTQVEASFVAQRLEGFGAFVRWHTGFDYYNVQFQDKRSFFAFGVLWDVSRLDRLASAVPQ